MAKQLAGTVKFQVPGGQATPAPPVGTALGRFGINLGSFRDQNAIRNRFYASQKRMLNLVTTEDNAVHTQSARETHSGSE